MDDSASKDIPSPKIMNYVGDTPEKNNEMKKVFDYVKLDSEFFQPTQEKEFDRYMAEHEEMSRIG